MATPCALLRCPENVGKSFRAFRVLMVFTAAVTRASWIRQRAVIGMPVADEHRVGLDSRGERIAEPVAAVEDN